MQEDLDEIKREEEHEHYMDSLKNSGVYLSGPIRCVDDNGSEWRDNITEDYLEIEFHNPLDRYDPDEVDILSDPINLDEKSDKEQILPSEYVFEDKCLINQSEAIFLGLPEEIARGSMMEVMYGYMRNIPFYVWVVDGQAESGWIFDHAEFISDDRDAVMKKVKEDFYNEEIDEFEKGVNYNA